MRALPCDADVDRAALCPEIGQLIRSYDRTAFVAPNDLPHQQVRADDHEQDADGDR